MHSLASKVPDDTDNNEEREIAIASVTNFLQPPDTTLSNASLNDRLGLNYKDRFLTGQSSDLIVFEMKIQNNASTPDGIW